jgi:hypothetical protein
MLSGNMALCMCKLCKNTLQFADIMSIMAKNALTVTQGEKL